MHPRAAFGVTTQRHRPWLTPRRRPCDRRRRIDAASQSRCFACVPRANFTDSTTTGCAPCFYQWVPASAREKCLACVESPKTFAAAKGTCAYCVGNTKGVAQAQKCLACLQTKRDEYSYSCVNG
jgi:hypothetical protein